MREARESFGDESLTTEAMTSLLRDNDERALSVLHTVCEAMGRGITSLVAVTDPEIIVIGGGVAVAGTLLTDPITASFARHYGAYERRPVPSIVVATMGNTAGVIGAADLARLASAPGA